MLKIECKIVINAIHGGVRWPGGRASDSKLRGAEFDPHSGHCVVSLCKTHYLPRVLVNIQEAVALFGHDLKITDWAVNLNTNKLSKT